MGTQAVVAEQVEEKAEGRGHIALNDETAQCPEVSVDRRETDLLRRCLPWMSTCERQPWLGTIH